MYSHVCGSSPPDPLVVEETMLAVLIRVVGLAYSARAGSAATVCAGAAATADGWRATSVAARSRQNLVERAREIIARRFRSRITLAELAREADTSVFHLCRAFRTVVGTTIHAYRGGLRLRAALHAVLDSRAELTEVALDAGYSSHSHFTAAFREEYGVTPSMVRRGHTFPRTRHSTFSRRRSTVPTTDGLFRPRAATR
jgi:AraC-like DNA-binding protein